MQEPAADEHIWVSEWEELSPHLEESPVEAIPEVHELITETMEGEVSSATSKRAQNR